MAKNDPPSKKDKTRAGSKTKMRDGAEEREKERNFTSHSLLRLKTCTEKFLHFLHD